MGKRQVIDDLSYVHFVTFTCNKRRRLLDMDRPKQIVLGVLSQELGTRQGTCVGFVVMPDHVHALVWFPEAGRLSEFMQGWKRKSSHSIDRWYRETKIKVYESVNDADSFWQKKYYSFEIYEEDKLREKLNYMHLNPVRAKLAERAVDWKWSSARWYECGKSVGVPLRWVY